MKQKYLILKGCAGLGNRLITLSNAIEYAKVTNRILYVDWSDGQFGVKGENVFYKYFQLKDVPHISSLEEIPGELFLYSYPRVWGRYSKSSLYDLYIQESGGALSSRLGQYFQKGKLSILNQGFWKYKGAADIKAKHNNCAAFKALLSADDIPMGGQYKYNIKEDVVFYADFCPKAYPDYIRNNIALKQELYEEIDALAEKYSMANNTVGLHIRMTDKQPSGKLSNIAQSVEKLKLDNPKLFIATDNSAVIDELSKYFDNIITLPQTKVELPEGLGLHQYAIRTGDYRFVDNQFKESIIDMWLLGRCNYLLAQGNSTFSLISSYLKNDNKSLTW